MTRARPEAGPSATHWLRFVLVALVFGGLGVWAGRATLTPAAVPQEMPVTEVVVHVTEQTVGRTLNLNVSASQPKRALAANVLAGVVTEVRPTGEVNVGDVLYRVAGTPVRAVVGQVPFHRALSSGAKGTDVHQLQDALVSMGLLRAADGTYGAPTHRAVRAWQGLLGVERTGAIALGELVAVPQLPAALVLDEGAISLGSVLSGGEKIVHGAVGEPTFLLRLGREQARLVPESATVAMNYQGHEWQAVITASEQNQNGETLFHLAARDGGPVCGADCGAVATGEEVFILSRVAVVPPASGPAVPVAAVTTKPDGSTSVLVVDAAGARSERLVTVLGSQDGVAVVEGVSVGDRVQVLSDAPATGEPARPALPRR